MQSIRIFEEEIMGGGKGETKPKMIAKTKTQGLKALATQQSVPR